MMTWFVSHAGPSITQQQVMAPSGPQAVVMLARGCPLTFHRDKWAPAQETMVPCSSESRLYSPCGGHCLPICHCSARVYTHAPLPCYLLKTNHGNPRPSKTPASSQMTHRSLVFSHTANSWLFSYCNHVFGYCFP